MRTPIMLILASSISMSAQQLNAFMERVISETTLQKKVGSVVNTDKTTWSNVIPIAKEEGFIISIEDLNEFDFESFKEKSDNFDETTDEELSLDQLQTVAGGWFSWCPWCG